MVTINLVIQVPVFIFLLRYLYVSGNQVPIKIVQEPASYGNVFPAPLFGNTPTRLVSRVSPSEVSGPLHLRDLSNHCYNLTDSKYRYMLCPFHNVSQHETTYRWNAYEGVLGIWRHWEIVNNTFVSMIYTNGDTCGNTSRTVKVYFKCGFGNRLVNVTEPRRCEYEAMLESPHVCSKDALLVYPMLDDKLQVRWDSLESQLRNKEITVQDYNVTLEEIFIESGLRQSQEKAQTTTSPETTSSAPNTTLNEVPHPFSDLGSCHAAYSDLKKEVEQLNEELAALKLLNEIKFKQPPSNL